MRYLWPLAVIAAFAAGWKISGWQRDSTALVIEQAAQRAGNNALQQMQNASGRNARALEEKLEALKNATPKTIHTDIVKPVFTHVCVSDDFIRMYNATAENTERALSGKPENKMSGKYPAP
ncbi:hypothetical protein [Pantoea sp. FN0307]|uniref:hypothetical protein n=1 Tax=Pantoea sp. FN0307 TaxID=3418560 RepID=UPI003CED9C16